MGKTGGDMVCYLMNKYYPQHIIFQHETKDPEKHCYWRNISKEYSNIKNIIVGIRRLPSWIVSHNSHHSSNYDISFDEIFNATRAGKLILKGHTTKHTPDEMLNNFLSIEVNTEFIRQEFLLSDFNKIMEKHFPSHRKNCEILNDKTIVNKNSNKLSINLTEKESSFLYVSNPVWTKIESTIYS